MGTICLVWSECSWEINTASKSLKAILCLDRRDLICFKLIPTSNKTLAFVVSNNMLEAIKLTEEIRKAGYTCEFDLTNKKFVKQLEKASKVAKYALIIGEDELVQNKVTVKNLDTSEQISIQRLNIIDFFLKNS